ncbi:MAG: tetratricopeptide repeat protein [Kofleriaceae bacterium]|nr:tetratricopeptide repeat protein [Kofleriaceae bacterium]
MRWTVAFLVAAACASTPKAGKPSTTVRAEIEQAEAAERVRQHDLARAHYQRAVAAAKDPASIAFARREFAETLMTWGEVPEAIAQLEGVVAAAPDHAAAWHDLGILRHNQGDDAGATIALERARGLLPEDPRPRIALAALRWQRGDRAGAQAEYRALLELDLPPKLRDKVKWALEELARPPPPARGVSIDRNFDVIVESNEAARLRVGLGAGGAAGVRVVF